ncbi:hypothetical protein Fot_28338 [Forsythia ovata]|uniref:Secreted protein n=1 Tax=Forsythia ovata TaxID=205694 RepID=A0ABD1TNS0_9LAMI
MAATTLQERCLTVVTVVACSGLLRRQQQRQVKDGCWWMLKTGIDNAAPRPNGQKRGCGTGRSQEITHQPERCNDPKEDLLAQHYSTCRVSHTLQIITAAVTSLVPYLTK